jgi:hypothetical protein
MAIPRRPMPFGFEADAREPFRILNPKYHCSWGQIKRWRKELGVDTLDDNRCHPVIQMDLNGNEIRRFDSIKEAALAVGGIPNNISMCLCGHYATAYKYKWRRPDES